MKLDSRHILILLGLALALSSCVQFSGQEGMAQLYPPVFEVDVTVEDLAQTKAEPAKPVPVAPTYPEVHFTVKDKDGNVVYDKLGVWDDPLKLPIGAYSIEAYSGSNTFGSAYFTGGASGTVAAGKEETPTISMALKNAYLAVGLTETLAKHFKTSGNCITISTASASIDTGLDTYVFVPSDQQLSIAISGTSSAGVPKTITHSLKARTAATATYLSCDMTTTNAPVITMSSNADDYGAWGTVAYIPFASTQNINAENAAKMEYWASSDGINFDIEGKIVEGVNVKFTGLTTGHEYSFCAKIGSITSDIKQLTVAYMPSIVVTATGTTSYDYYLAYKKNGVSSKLEKANNAAPETVSGIGYSVSGIDNKLKQPKFGYSETLKYDGSTVPQNTTKEYESWGQHTVSATVTFAEQTFNGEKVCHVTGLPYKAVPPTSNSNDIHKWNKKRGTISWESDKVTLSWATGAYPCIYSPDFHIPNDINVSARTKIVRNKTNLNYNSELGIWVNENDKAYSANLNNGSTFENTISETMTATYNKWYIQYNYMAAGPKTYVYYFNIDYN